MAAAAGGGGGRSFPVYIDYISRNGDKAISDLNKVSAAATNVGKASGGVDKTATSVKNFGGASEGAAVATANLSRGVHSAETNLKGTGQQAVMTSRGVMAMSTSMDSAGSGAQTLARNTGRASTAFAAFRNSGRGAQFAMIGLGGSINEAIFMTQSLVEQQSKQAAAQAEVDRLIAEGKQHTSDYTSATNDLADATRGANFTFRIFLQSWLDNITFGGMLLSQLPKVINEYRRLRTESASAGAAMATQGGIIGRLRGLFSSLAPSIASVAPAATGAATSIQAVSRTATGAGTAVSAATQAAIAAEQGFVGVARSATGISGTFTNVASSATGLSGALAKVAPGAAAAAASTLPLAAGMKLVDTTSKSIVPSLTGANTATKAMGVTNVATTATFPGLIAGMRAFGAASMAFIRTPIGIILVAIAALITGLIALKENWGGSADAMYEFGQQFKPVNEQLKFMDGALWGLIPNLEKTSQGLGIVAPEARKVAEEAKKMDEEIQGMIPGIRDATNAALGFGISWQKAAENATEFMGNLAVSGNQMTDSLTANMQVISNMLAQNPTNQALKELADAMAITTVSFQKGFQNMQHILDQTAIDAKTKINLITTVTGSLANAFATLPGPIQTHMEKVVEALDLGIEGNTQFKISTEEAAAIIQGVVEGKMVPAMQKLPPEVQKNVEAMINWANATATPNDNIQLAIALTQQFGNALLFESGVLEETTAKTEERSAAQERAAEAAKYETDALMGLNVQSQGLLQSNRDIILGIQEQGQAFNETAVMMNAHQAGMQEWRDVQAQAYFDIVKTATALGFQGEMTKANVVAMLDHIAVTERQNEANATAVEGFFSLSEEQRKLIDSSGLMAERMGQVALATQDVSVADASLIAEQVKLNTENQKAVETYLNLDAAQQQNLATMGVTPDIIQQVIDGTLTLDQAMLQAIDSQGKAAEAVDSHTEAIAGLLPMLQKYAETLGLVGLTAEQLTPVQEALTQHVTDLGGAFDTAIQDTVNFVAAQGKVGDIVGMTAGQLLEYIATMEITNETMKTSAEIAQEASQKLADAWEADLERAVQAWETTSDQLKSAAEDIGDDIGDAGAEAATKFTDEFLGKFVPAQLVEEAFDKNIDIADVIDDIQDEAEDALDDGLISEMTMDQAIQPMIDALEEIPGENEKAMGEAIAIWRHYSQNLRPILVGGIHEVGAEAVKAFETGVFQPIQAALEAGGGTGVWQPLVTSFSDVVNALGPEYDRMKGDFNKMLELTKGDTRAQVNAILPILREINPTWAAIIEEMDTDGDGIKDIFDNDIKSPAEQMREALVTAFADIFDALSLVNPEFAKAADYLRGLLSGAQGAAGQFDILTRAIYDTKEEMAALQEVLDASDALLPKIGSAEARARGNLTAFGYPSEGEGGTGLGGAGGGGVGVGGGGGGAVGAGGGGGGGTAAFDTTGMDAYIAKLNEVNALAATVIPAIETLWTNHFTNTTAQMNAFISGPVSLLAQAYTQYQTNVIPILQAMELAWTMHLANNGVQITTFIGGPLALLAQAYTQYQTNVIPILAAMELAWTNHLINNGAQITAFIGGPIALLAQAYVQFQANVVPILAAMELAWTNHLNNNGQQIAAFISGPINGYINAMPLVSGAVHSNLENANQNWSAHADHIGNVVSDISGHVGQLARAVAAAMRSIANSMGIAEQAARDLQSAINALQSKTITVTTRYVTSGVKAAASGYDGIVRGPQLFLAGEEGPERVKITPLSSSGGGGGSGVAEQVGGIIHAAKGADMIVGSKLDAKAVSNFAGERGMRLDEFKESEEGKQIDIEVRKVYKSGWIDKDDWKDFGKEYGYRISDFDKKKNGKLADIMFKRMKGVRFQEKDLDWDEETGEPARKTVDWGQTRAGGAAADQDSGAVGTVMGPQLGMRATATGRGGGGGGGSLSYDSRSGGGGPITVHTTLNLSLNVDKRNFGKLVQEVTTEGYNTTK